MKGLKQEIFQDRKADTHAEPEVFSLDSTHFFVCL